MRRRVIETAAALVAALAAPPALAFPDVSECKGALQPSAPGACKGIGATGCCDGSGRAFWCEGGDLFCLDCNAGFAYCGWNDFGYYDCGQELGSADPSKATPYLCSKSPCTCGPEEVCLDDGSCYLPDCAGKDCGVDPLGFSCGSCDVGYECVEGLDLCMPLPTGCAARDGAGCKGCACEDCVCGKYPNCCTDGWDVFCASACESECGMDCDACPPEPSCDGLECGTFCGVDCGGCPGGATCVAFECCIPTCAGKSCGPDGCGGTCGSCAGGKECQSGKCVDCAPKCDGKVCGPDGCGGSCGSCPAGQSCDGGKCQKGCCDGKCGQEQVACSTGSCFCDEECFFYDDCCPGLCASCGKDFPAECCVPDCAFKSCGDDGCGGSCGSCPPGRDCEDGTCVACEPDCAGKVCGSDGCGGTCGSCPAGESCDEASFLCVPCEPKCAGKDCGDDGCGSVCGICDEASLCGPASKCIPSYCAGHCGDSAVSCGAGCQCYCDELCWEFGDCCLGICTSCEEDFPDLCGDACGGCPLGLFCIEGACIECTPKCEGKVCGPDTCGGSCGSCPPGTACNTVGFCEDCTPDCNDPTTGKPKVCGDDGCGGSCGTCAPGTECEVTPPKTPGVPTAACVPDGSCEGIGPAGCCHAEDLRLCGEGDASVTVLDCTPSEPCGWDPSAPGPDGAGAYACGGEGSDPSGAHPFDCYGLCVPNCALEKNECGDDGCGGSCGTCAEGLVCQVGVCVPPCEPDCADRPCGPDGCGGSCGACEPGFACEDTAAAGADPPPPAGTPLRECAPCTATCKDPETNKKIECGDDGCGGSCGTCQTGLTCVFGKCSGCLPDCAGKVCGPDGCGGVCGPACTAPLTCQAGQCKDLTAECKAIGFEGECDGTTLRWCDSQNVLQTRDCADLGLVCGDDPDTGRSCVEAGSPGPDPEPGPGGRDPSPGPADPEAGAPDPEPSPGPGATPAPSPEGEEPKSKGGGCGSTSDPPPPASLLAVLIALLAARLTLPIRRLPAARRGGARRRPGTPRGSRA